MSDALKRLLAVKRALVMLAMDWGTCAKPWTATETRSAASKAPAVAPEAEPNVR